MTRSSAGYTTTRLIQNTLAHAAAATSFWGYPLSWERLEIDDNRSLWASTALDYQAHPPLKGQVSADLAIIGAGFTGVSTAYHFSRRYPEKRVVLLEAKSLANGASGRNGGMMLNWLPGVAGDDELTKLDYTVTNAAIDMIEGIIKEHELAVSYRRDGSLVVYTHAERAEAAHRHAEHLQSLGIPVQFLDRAALRGMVALEGAHGATLDPNEGQLNGAQFVRALKPVLLAAGVQIYEGTPVLKVQEGKTITLTTPGGTVQAGAIVLATNGYTGKLGYFRKAIFPLHSHVFATAPLTNEQLAALGWHAGSGYSDDLDRISYSSLTREGQMVFGGGSNLSYAYQFNNRTAYNGNAEPAFADMQNTLYQYLPGARGLPISHRWTGTLAISLRRNCAIGVMGEQRNVYYGLGYSGHGVTAANLAGKIITDCYSGSDEQWRKLPIYNAGFAPIPLEPFRWMGYHLMTKLTGKSPRI